MKLTISNEFHNTKTTVDTDRPLTRKRVQAIKRRLCCADCTCSDDLGQRGEVSDRDEYERFLNRAQQVVGTGRDE